MSPELNQQITQQFQSELGRPPTGEELNFLSNAYGPGREQEAANAHINSFKQAMNQTIALGAAYGTTLDPNQAREIIDRVYKPGDYATFNNLRSFVEPIISRQVAKQEQEAILRPPVTQDHTGTAARIVQEVLGRPANQDELDFYGKILAQGDSPFELAQFLKTTPDYVNAENEKQQAKMKQEADLARTDLNNQLIKDEDEAYKRALPKIISQFMRAGRIGSSGLESAVARERARLLQERQGFLANQAFQDAQMQQGYRREDFVNARSQAFNQYLRQNEPSYQQRLGYAQLPFQNMERSYGLIDQGRQRGYELEDYEREKSDFDRYLQQSRKSSRESALYGFGGQLLGAGLQGYTYGRASR